MKKTNTNKTKKFLSLALLLAISFNQVSFCMKREVVIEIEEKPRTENIEVVENQNLKQINDTLREGNAKLIKFYREKKEQKEAENRDKSLGDLSVLQNEIIFNIFSFANMKSLKNLLSTSKSSIFRDIFLKSPENKNFAEILKKIEKIKNDQITGSRLIILHGPTQAGKSYTAQKTITKNIFNLKTYISAISTDVLSKYVGGSEKIIKSIFDRATKLNEKFGTIIIDELDPIGLFYPKTISFMQEILDRPEYKNCILILTAIDINSIPNKMRLRADLIVEINRQLSWQISDFYEPQNTKGAQNNGAFTFLKSIFGCCSNNNRE